jgi:hypothetical protein
MEQSGGPKGDRLAGYVGPGTLRPGVGKLVQRSGTPHYCGAMAGIAFGCTTHPNSKDPKRTSTRFVGDCIAILHNGQVVQVGEFYLPKTLERIIAANVAGGANQVPFSIEVWCEPDAEGRTPSPLGYSYITYNRRIRAENDPVLALAYASGLIEEPPAPASAPMLTDQSVDPETGEVLNGNGDQPSPAEHAAAEADKLAEQRAIREANDKRKRK